MAISFFRMARWLPAARWPFATRLLLALPLLLLLASACDAAPIGYQAVPRDGFPVFNNPAMLTAAKAEELGLIFERDAIIGVAHGGEAKAYPITIMGVHELGNDTIDGIPISQHRMRPGLRVAHMGDVPDGVDLRMAGQMQRLRDNEAAC